MRRDTLPISVDEKYRLWFMKKFVQKKTDRCWHWVGQLTSAGYAYFKMRQKYYVGSRVSYSIFKGEIPNKTLVLHTCDNPKCVNPEHLFLGTDADNNKDKCAKGRHVNWRTKVTHCAKGHPYEGDNLLVEKSGKRRCATCRRMNWANQRKRAKDKKNAMTNF